MLSHVISSVASLSPSLRRWIWKRAYQAINRKFSDVSWHFLNYGYMDLDPSALHISLEKEDEVDRDFIELYHHVASSASLPGKEALEVGSGRGGGSSYIARYLKPRALTGVDRSDQAVAYCRRQHPFPNLEFQVGDAEALPFKNERFDAVVNVESSHCYGSMRQFLKEVRRVLRPGGTFAWADFRPANQVEALDRAFEEAEFVPSRKEDITANVLASLDRSHDRKKKAIHGNVPKFFISSLLEFAGVRGSAIYNAFQTREKIYLHYVCKKV